MENPSVIFGENCFDDSVMQNRLPKETYKALRRTIEEGRSLDPSLAGVIANAKISNVPTAGTAMVMTPAIIVIKQMFMKPTGTPFACATCSSSELNNSGR